MQFGILKKINRKMNDEGAKGNGKRLLILRACSKSYFTLFYGDFCSKKSWILGRFPVYYLQIYLFKRKNHL
jgi:hypothetical protein